MDKLAHGLALYAATITLHLLGFGSLPTLGTVTASAIAWEARKVVVAPGVQSLATMRGL